MSNVISDALFLDLRQLLQFRVVDIKFKKKDGSIRDMKVTLCPNLLPPREYNEDGTEKPPHRHSDTTQVVYDLDAKEFKSFIKANLISFTVNITQEEQ